jgi:hypothetical protein
LSLYREADAAEKKERLRRKKLMEALHLVLMAYGSRDRRWRTPFERFVSTLKADLGTHKVRLASHDRSDLPRFLLAATTPIDWPTGPQHHSRSESARLRQRLAVRAVSLSLPGGRSVVVSSMQPK